MAYCNTTTDLLIFGRYRNDSIPNTEFSSTDLSYYVNKIYRDINSKLYKAGLINLPLNQIDTPNAYERLKDLNIIGVIYLIERELYDRSNIDGIEKEVASKVYSQEYYATLKEYCDDPVYTLFEGDDETIIDQFLSSRINVKPKGNIIYSQTATDISAGTLSFGFTNDERF